MAAISSILIGSVLVGSAVYGAERQATAQRRALREQRQAQDAALAATIRQERNSAEAIARANRKQPDLGAMIAGQLAASAAGGNRATQLSRGTLGGASLLDPLSAKVSTGQLLGQ